MCTLLKVANRMPVDLISPFLVHKEQITSVGSTGANSTALACFSCTGRIFSALSMFFMRFPRFGTFTVHAAPCPCWSLSAMHPQRVADIDCESCGLFAHLYYPLTKELQFLHVDKTFGCRGIYWMFSQFLKYQPQVFAMVLCGTGKYQDVVNKDDNNIIKIFAEDVLY